MGADSPNRSSEAGGRPHGINAALTTSDGFFSLAAVCYLVSAILRTRLAPAEANAAALDLIPQLQQGGYQAPLALAAILAAGASFAGFSGMVVNLALLIEAQLLLAAGLRFGRPFPRLLAAGIFAASPPPGQPRSQRKTAPG